MNKKQPNKNNQPLTLDGLANYSQEVLIPAIEKVTVSRKYFDEELKKLATKKEIAGLATKKDLANVQLKLWNQIADTRDELKRAIKRGDDVVRKDLAEKIKNSEKRLRMEIKKTNESIKNDLVTQNREARKQLEDKINKEVGGIEQRVGKLEKEGKIAYA